MTPIDVPGHPATPSPRRQVWCLRLDDEAPRLPRYWSRLDAAEKQRACSYRHEADRARFVVARGSLRELLGLRLGIDPGKVVFARNAFGKPMLRDTGAALHFNTSHSGNWVLHALDGAAPIGIDVEAVRPELGDVAAFAQVLSEPEQAHLHALAPPQRARAMATIWVRKEAYVKALGVGLSRPLRQISIAPDSFGTPRLQVDRSERSHAGAAARWRFDDLDLDADHVACLVHGGDA